MKEGLEINQAFHNLNSDKQRRIINAALKEFAKNGYDNASTNQIVKDAAIGKGMLFYYFNNKKELYHYLVDYCLDITVEEYIQRIDTNEPDFIDRLRQAAKIKIEYHLRNPQMFNFLGNLFLKEEAELPENFTRRYGELVNMANSKLYSNVDKTVFRNDIDINKAFQLIQWSFEGYQNDLLNRLKGKDLATVNVDPLWDEFYDYLDVLKTIFYT